MIISISGMDNSGKTTQAKRLIELYPDVFVRKIHIADTPSFDKPRYDYNWWFKQSTPEEFVHAIYRSLEERIEMAKALDEENKIVIIEKGLDFYDARILSTLISKGLSLESAILLQRDIRFQYRLEDIEEIKFYLNPGPFKRKSDLDDNPEYQMYLRNNKRILDLINPDYIEIDPDEIDVVTSCIVEEIERRRVNRGKKRILSRNTNPV